jgi:alkylhydroperoxidase family enzyme
MLAALRGERVFTEERLAALEAFTRSVLDRTGDVEPRVWTRFLAARYSHEQALDIVLGIATYTLSTFTNRLVENPTEGPLREFV